MFCKRSKPLKLDGSRGLSEEAGDKTRTCDRLITNQLLYQLSYTSISFNISNSMPVKPAVQVWIYGCSSIRGLGLNNKP